MKNSEKSFGADVVSRTLVAGAMFGAAAMVVKTSDYFAEGAQLERLEQMDRTEAGLVTSADEKQAQLRATSPAAEAIIGQCSSALQKCIGKVQVPFENPCKGIMVDTMDFHNLIAKPRVHHMILTSQPDVYTCDIPVQQGINDCRQSMLKCLDTGKN